MTEAKQRYLAWLEATQLPVSTQFSKLTEETRETLDPVFGLSAEQMNQLPQNDPELADHIAHEATDVAIVAIAIIHLLGHDFEALYRETVEKIERKYPTNRIEELRALGLATQAIMAMLKDEWNAKQSEPEQTDVVPTLMPVPNGNGNGHHKEQISSAIVIWQQPEPPLV